MKIEITQFSDGFRLEFWYRMARGAHPVINSDNNDLFTC